MTATGNITGSF